MTYIARSPLLAARMIGDELMIMSARESSLYTLNDTGSVLWEAADGVTPLDEIVRERICGQFDVEERAALRDAEELVGEMAAHGLVRVSEAPIVEGEGTA
jgi:hypothetical protein